MNKQGRGLHLEKRPFSGKSASSNVRASDETAVNHRDTNIRPSVTLRVRSQTVYSPGMLMAAK